MENPPLPLLRAPCTCAPGHHCAVCRAYERRAPATARRRTLGGLRGKLVQLQARLVQEQHLLDTQTRRPLETPHEWRKRRKYQGETVARVQQALRNLEQRLAAWLADEVQP